MGDQYVPTSLAFGQTIGLLEQAVNPQMLQEAHSTAEAFWNEHGVRAMKENGCE
jgi:hypothetical protein